MNESDLFPFLDVFKTLTKVFPFRGDEAETTDIGRAYFKTLRKFPLDQVKLGADNCMATMEKFPKPAEWMKHIPRRIPGPEIPVLTATEESEWRHAESLGYEGECCRCAMCRELGADTLKTRFVPLDPEEPAMMADRRVLRGQWIHGEPLQRWYAAKAAFWASFDRMADGKAMPSNTLVAPMMRNKLSAQERIEAVYASKTCASRDPGEEG